MASVVEMVGPLFAQELSNFAETAGDYDVFL
jgi:hypothetical protein